MYVAVDVHGLELGDARLWTGCSIKCVELFAYYVIFKLYELGEGKSVLVGAESLTSCNFSKG